LWLKIITATFQTSTAAGPNIRQQKGTSKSDQKTRRTSPIHQPTEDTWHKTQ